MFDKRVVIGAALIVALCVPLQDDLVQGQGQGPITAFGFDQQTCQLTFVVGRTFYTGSLQVAAGADPFPAQIPGTQPVVATGFCESQPQNGGYFAVLANGDVYETTAEGSFWVASGSVLNRRH